MKLIIDIPEGRYKQVCEEQWLPNRLYFERAIANGTPLDDVKAEIADMDGDINGYYVHKDDVLSIIDKHIRGKEN